MLYVDYYLILRLKFGFKKIIIKSMKKYYWQRYFTSTDLKKIYEHCLQ